MHQNLNSIKTLSRLSLFLCSLLVFISAGDKKEIFIEIPRTQAGELIISHTGYTLSFNTLKKQANWVAYELTAQETCGIVSRSSSFKEDPELCGKCACNADYTKSGFDKGHLAPAKDMAWSEIAMKESFYYSNVSPQNKSFNRGIWKKLETLVRSWAVEYGSLAIVTGPVFTDHDSCIGNHVIIPSYFFKVILDYREPGLKAAGFIFPNSALSGQPVNYCVSVDSVEKISGFDFFPLLPDDIENEIESRVTTGQWTW